LLRFSPPVNLRRTTCFRSTAVSHPAEGEPADQHATSEGELLRPPNAGEVSEQPPEVVTLGIGSRSSWLTKAHHPAPLPRLRGLLPVPPEVEAEASRQEATNPMTLEYRKALRDRLTLEHYFADVEVAFRRRPEGIEVLAAGLDEIAEFRRSSGRDERQGVVYGVG
jgi:hypothetical protein